MTAQDFETNPTGTLAELEALKALINTPELVDFPKAVHIEAVHQRQRWGEEVCRSFEEFSSVLTRLHGKAIQAFWDKDIEKALHHLVTSAALLNNWHAYTLDKRTGSEQAAG